MCSEDSCGRAFRPSEAGVAAAHCEEEKSPGPLAPGKAGTTLQGAGEPTLTGRRAEGVVSLQVPGWNVMSSVPVSKAVGNKPQGVAEQVLRWVSSGGWCTEGTVCAEGPGAHRRDCWIQGLRALVTVRMAGPGWLERCVAGQPGGLFTKERVRGQWSQLDCRSAPSGGPVKRLSLSQGPKKALGEVARCWSGLHPGAPGTGETVQAERQTEERGPANPGRQRCPLCSVPPAPSPGRAQHRVSG